MNNLVQVTNTDPKNYYWGFWATTGFALLTIVVFGILQSVILLAYVFIQEGAALTQAFNSGSTDGLSQFIMKYAYDGDAISFAEIPSALIGTGMVILFVSMHKPLSVKEYLGLYRPKIKPLLAFLGLMILAIVLMEFSSAQLGIETPEFMSKVYSSTDNMPLLLLAVGVAAPFFEEFLFRGFILEGLRHTSLGVTGAVLVSSASFALIHMQYGWFEIISIFLIGILLAIAKLRTKSLYVPIAMHMFMNLAASAGMALSS